METMMRRSLIVACVVGLSTSAASQETTGAIRGRLVVDSAGVAGVTVTATGPNLLGSRRATSVRDGVFILRALPQGTYTLRITSMGYRPVQVDSVQVTLGGTAGLADIQLTQIAVQMGEVKVSASQLTLDPERTTIGAVLTASDYASLPAERDYTALLATLPHVNVSYRGDPVNSAGATGLENVYFIDGVNVTQQMNAGSGTSLPSNFIRAVEVKNGGYEAQYGKALGALVNAVTYSGSNTFESSFFAFMTNDGLSARPRAEPSLREVSSLSYDIGVRVGGPIVRDRLWYSAAYNPQRSLAERELGSLGVFSDERTAHLFATKASWRMSDRTNVELSLFGDPVTRRAVEVPLDVPAGLTPGRPDPYLSNVKSGGTVASLRTQTLAANNLLFETAASLHNARAVRQGTPEAVYIDMVASRVEGGLDFRANESLRRVSLSTRATLASAGHTAVAGAELENVTADREAFAASIFRGTTDTWISVNQLFPETRGQNRVLTTYAQDAWRITEDLTANAGVRWSLQTFKASRGERAQFRPEWQPRLGIVWRVRGSDRQRLMASYGRFFQQDPVNIAWLFLNTGPERGATIGQYVMDPRQPGAIPSRVDTIGLGTSPAVDVDRLDLEAESLDEFTAGYERLLRNDRRFSIRLIQRDTRSSLQWGFAPQLVLGMPGRGDFSFLPSPTRTYQALEVSTEGRANDVHYRASYVLSRLRGNYPGIHDTDYAATTYNAGVISTLSSPHQAVNSSGLLPSDRTHVLKLAASRNWATGLSMGALVTSESGSPLNEFGAAPAGWFPATAYAFAVPRGTAGRTETLWNLDMRLAYDRLTYGTMKSRILLDILHLGNPQRPVRVEELRYLTNADGTFSNPNPNYGIPIAFQRPAVVRLGVELSR
jgi:hypothetical protein